MSVFQYKALNKDNQTVSGLIDAATEEMAVGVLRDKNLSPIFVKEEKRASLSQFQFLDRVKAKDIVIFSRQFAVLISANVAMVQALKIVVEQTESIKLKMIISEIADEIDAGTRLSESLAKHPKIFSNFYISVVRSGETSGTLEEILSYLADEMEKDYDMMGKIKGAMIYPAFVLSGLVVVGVVMMVFVVPKLTGILSETGATLPLATRVLMGTSGFLAAYWWGLLTMLIGAAIGLRAYLNTAAGKAAFDMLKLQLPVFGKLFQMIYLVRFARSMNTLIVGGVTITKSLKIAADVVNNQVYKNLIDDTVKEVEEGNSISTVFSTSKQIPRMVSQMMSIGEKTGKLDVVLKRITDFYGREISNMVANLMTLIEPLIMVLMGVAVGIMVAAIIMPMYNMASQF